MILTRSSVIRALNTVIVVPITTTIRGVPAEVYLSVEDGLRTDCVANFFNIQTVAKADLGRFIANLSPERMGEVDRAILYALGVDSV